MDLLSKFLLSFKAERMKEEEGEMDEHSVRLQIPLPGEMPTPQEFERYAKLEDVLDAVAQREGVGELDGNDFGKHEYAIWFCGADGSRLAGVIKEVLGPVDLPTGSTLYIRYGALDSPAKVEIIPIR
jgi:hypothetical protein